MRNRLIELLQKADKKCNDTKQCENCVGYGEGNECVNHLIADSLLANGVIAPTVFVGQTVYYFSRDLGAVFPYFVENIYIGFLGKEKTHWSFEANFHDEETDELIDEIDFDLDDIGKTVFLTKEEAEKALAERSNR